MSPSSTVERPVGGQMRELPSFTSFPRRYEVRAPGRKVYRRFGKKTHKD